MVSRTNIYVSSLNVFRVQVDKQKVKTHNETHMVQCDMSC